MYLHKIDDSLKIYTEGVTSLYTINDLEQISTEGIFNEAAEGIKLIIDKIKIHFKSKENENKLNHKEISRSFMTIKELFNRLKDIDISNIKNKNIELELSPYIDKPYINSTMSNLDDMYRMDGEFIHHLHQLPSAYHQNIDDIKEIIQNCINIFSDIITDESKFKARVVLLEKNIRELEESKTKTKLDKDIVKYYINTAGYFIENSDAYKSFDTVLEDRFNIEVRSSINNADPMRTKYKDKDELRNILKTLLLYLKRKEEIHKLYYKYASTFLTKFELDLTDIYLALK